MSRIVAGRRIVGMLRPTECGHWYLTTDGENLGGALLIDPALAHSASNAEDARAGPAALVDEVRAARTAALPGVLAIADLVVQNSGPQAGHVWLLTDAPPGPTVRDLLELGPAHGLGVGSAATLLNETAQTILGLHRAGIVHGGLGPSSVFVAADGKAALGEVALASALGLRSANPADDVHAWAQLATLLAREWAEDVQATDMLTHAAAIAARTDLVQARDALLAGRGLLPPDFLERRELIAAVAEWRGALREHVERGQSAEADSRIDLSEGVTSLLAAPGSAPARHDGDETVAIRAGWRPTVPPRQPPSPTVPWNDRDGSDGFRQAGNAGAPVDAGWEEQRFNRHRYDPGPPEPVGPLPRQPHPPEGDRGQRWHDPSPYDADFTRPRSARRRRWALIVGVAAALAALAAAGFLWWRGQADELAVERVSVQAPTEAVACDSTAQIVGIIETNGAAGEVSYRWVRDDGGQAEDGAVAPAGDAEVLAVQVPDGQTRTEVYLRWTFEGEGTLDATANLEILEPAAATAAARVSYVCE